jgi:hypothetical protein
VAELVDALDSKSSSARSAGSIPARGTNRAFALMDQFQAHILGMRGFVEWIIGIYYCDCGAKYRVRVTRTPFPDTDDARCGKCGAVMDSWRKSTGFRSYQRIDEE